MQPISNKLNKNQQKRVLTIKNTLNKLTKEHKQCDMYSIINIGNSNKVQGQLWLGIIGSNIDNSLQENRIEAVVSLERNKSILNIPFHLFIKIYDLKECQIKQYFEQTYEFIDKHLQSTNVLVYCQAGISRSVTIVISYLMKKFEQSLQESIQYLKTSIPQIYLSEALISDLIIFEDELLNQQQKEDQQLNNNRRKNNKQYLPSEENKENDVKLSKNFVTKNIIKKEIKETLSKFKKQKWYQKNLILKNWKNKNQGNLWLGNKGSSKNKSLQENGIKAVVSLERYKSTLNIPYHLFIKIDDLEECQIKQHFEQTYEFIDKHLQCTNVLVHCQVGISRSATIVIFYLMKKFNWNLIKAIKETKAKRDQIYPNEGFIRQLQFFEDELQNQVR